MDATGFVTRKSHWQAKAIRKSSARTTNRDYLIFVAFGKNDVPLRRNAANTSAGDLLESPFFRGASKKKIFFFF